MKKILGTFVFGVWASFLLTAQAQVPYYADAARPDDTGDGLSWGTAKKTLQAAVDSAPAGATVWAADGSYNSGTRQTPAGNLPCRLVLTNNVTVRGTNEMAGVLIVGAADPVATNGFGAVRCVYMSTGALQNVTLTNGFTGTGTTNQNTYGGGVYATGGFLTNCTITGCGALYGGGAYQARLYKCRIVGNWATFRGGGVHTCTIDDCDVSTNRVTSTSTSGYAGGVYNGTARNSRIAGNTNAGNFGGGAYFGAFTNCVFFGNYAGGYAGGAYLTTLTDCRIENNTASSSGGGLREGTANNCTIRGNTAVTADGGGSYLGVLSNCTVEANSAGRYGGGSSLSVMTNCAIRGNSAITSGGGAQGGTLVNCRLLDNRTPGIGGGAISAVLSGCLVAGNEAKSFGGGLYGGTQQFCTVAANVSPEGAGVYGSVMRNSLVWGNTLPGGPLDNYNYTAVFSNSCSYPLPAGANNNAADPLFVSVEGYDFRLRTGSPAIDAGVTADATLAVDAAGAPRIQGVRPDLGAYEGAVSGAVVTVRIVGAGSVSPQAGVFPGPASTVTFTATSVLGRAFVEYRLNGSPVGTDPALALSGITSDSILVAEFAHTDYYADAARPDDAGAGTSWATAKRTLQAAVDLAGEGDVVRVADGLYNAGSLLTPGTTNLCRLVVTNDVTVRSENGPAGAIIAGAADPATGNLGPAAVRGVFMSAGVLDGFTIRDGYALGGTGADLGTGGGGVYATGGYLTNCVIVACMGRNGGGVFGATLYGCRVERNSAGNYGGGGYKALLVNCAVVQNSAALNGGGLYGSVASGSRLEGNKAPLGNGGGAGFSDLFFCRIEKNIARIGGGAAGGRLQNSLLVRNEGRVQGGGADSADLAFCTVADNIGYEGAGLNGGKSWNTVVWNNRRVSGITNDYWGVSFANSCMTPVAAGAGNLSADPLFVCAEAGDYRLRAGSPCRDAGSAALWILPLVDDLAGNSRIEGIAPDVGAYEGVVSGAVVRISVTGPGTVSPSNSTVLATGGSVTFTASNRFAARPFVRYLLNGAPAGTDPELTLNNVQDGSRLVAEFQQNTFYADAARPDDSGDGTSWGTAKQTLQAAVDAALEGDTVLAADGKYVKGGMVSPGGTLPCRLVITNAITVRSLNGPAYSTIGGGMAARGTSAVRCVYMSAGSLEGFRVDTGATFNVTLPVIDAYGGGLFVPEFANVTVVSSEVIRCLAEVGAGVYALGNFVMDSCVVTNNTATYKAGGVYGGTVRNSSLSRNNGVYQGGGLHSGVAINCVLVANNCGHNSASAGGGACYATLYNCSVISNTCNSSAAGIAATDAFDCYIYKNRVTRNDNLSAAGGSSGGFLSHCWIEGNMAVSSAGCHGGVLRNCVIFRNIGSSYSGNSTSGHAGGAYGAAMFNCVVAYNEGTRYGGVQGGTMSNSVVLYNIVFTNGLPSNYSGGTFRYSASNPLPAGEGNIEFSEQSELFVGASNGNLRLRAGSPCINAGTNDGVTCSYDLDARPRILGKVVDMGAYEADFRKGSFILIR